MTDSNWDQIHHDQNTLERAEKISKAYLDARDKFKTAADDNPFLKGNDNFVGRIAEMLAILHFRNSGIQDIRRPKSKSHKGVDLLLTEPKGDERLISVKCITHENQSKRSSRIRWNGDDEKAPLPPPDNFEVWLVLIEHKTFSIHNVSDRCRRNGRHLKYTYLSHVPEDQRERKRNIFNSTRHTVRSRGEHGC